jgi:MFS family permease
MKSLVKRINRTVYYGWIIVLLSAFALFFSSPGQTYSINVFAKIYEEELGFSKTLITTGYSVATIISGTLLIFMGRLIDRFGHRLMMPLVIFLLALTTLFSSYVTTLAMIYLSFFFLRFFGQGSLTLMPNSLVPQWFMKKRALAISLMTLGAFVGTLFVPALNLYLIGLFGWRNVWRLWGLVLLVVMFPLAVLFTFNRPEDVGLSIDNEVSLLSKEEAYAALEKESWTVKEALKTRSFWFVGLIGMIAPMFTTGVTFHFYAIMESRSVSPETAAWIIGFIAFPTLIMPFLAHVFIERFKPRQIFFLTQSMFVVSMLFLLFFVRNEFLAFAFILFYGLFVALQAVTMNVVWPLYFGRKYLGSIRGAATVFMVVGSALGPLPFGLSFDLFGSFNPALIVMIALTIGTNVMALFIHKPEKKAQRKPDFI